ncbi:hypothetical protein T05_1888 [Trichinella murrelli]|uniref:Uncharacterized protein n=1 Tax=Trichinella murrelli TaxID=144512 RepID=A0A0V0TT09_9BILA|nr:hypothetical protein T05_1888 [Trichinella murrelli]
MSSKSSADAKLQTFDSKSATMSDDCLRVGCSVVNC